MIAPPRGPRRVLWVVVVVKFDDADRGRVKAGGTETGNMGDICHTIGADIISDLLERLEIDGTGVCRCTADDDLGLLFLCHLCDHAVIEHLGLRVNAILGYLVKFPGEADR